MGLHSGAMTHALFVVVIVAVLAVTVKSVDYRCTYTETKVANCSRTVFYPCPGGSPEESSEESSEEGSEPGYPSSRKRRSIGDFISSIMRRMYRGSNTNWCQKEEVFTCVMYRCYVGCCPGWKYDEVARTCSIPENPKPAIECLNGGNAVTGADGPRCECPAMYTGTRCEEAKCDLECLNDGMCDLVYGRPKCVCSDDFRGPRCGKPVCEGGCGRHGRCVAEDGKAVCRCRDGFRGPHCEIRIPKPEKEGDCPPITSTTVGTCIVGCETDSNCPNKQKCCSNGCGRVCRHPANYTCIHAGNVYKIGEVFYPDTCHVCTCLIPDQSKPFGGAQCRAPTCPPIKSGCQKVEKSPYSCCEHCAVANLTTMLVTTKPTSGVTTGKPDEEPGPNYEEPRFLNCPASIVTIDVAHDRNEARLPFTLKAVDYEDNKLEVTLSRAVFQAGIGAENFDTVIATSSRDPAGKYAYCEFHVRIRDVHAPNFTFCPTDVFITEEGKATWKLPTAVDNVGLVRPPTSNRFKPGDLFRKGDHPIVYSSEDYEGNIARCHFFVKVSHHDASHQGRDDDDDRSHHKQRHLMFIGSGIAAFLFIVVIVIVAVLCRRRRASRRDAPPQSPAYENGIYNVGAVMPPPYKEKPPVYVSESESVPEKKPDKPEGDKAALDVGDVDLKLGVDNPLYRM